MNRHQIPALALALIAAAAGCEKPAESTKAESAIADTVLLSQREARLADALAHGDSIPPDKAIGQWRLPAALNEISGLALTANGRLLTHEDQRGRVFEVDYRRGIVVKEFAVGAPAVHGDFESIAIVGDSVMLLTSGGMLYTFPEGADGAIVPFTMRDTGLGDDCEFEGMAYEAASRTLLLACKKVHGHAMRDSLVIFRLPRDTVINGKGRKPAHLAIPLAKIIGVNGWDGFHPSDLVIDPFNGNYLMVASREKAIAEITPTGEVVFSRPLPPGHEQAEGVAITRDHILIVSDEAKSGPALITLYRWPR